MEVQPESEQETPPRTWGRHQHIVFSGVLKHQIYNNCTPQGFRISITFIKRKSISPYHHRRLAADQDRSSLLACPAIAGRKVLLSSHSVAL